MKWSKRVLRTVGSIIVATPQAYTGFIVPESRHTKRFREVTVLSLWVRARARASDGRFQGPKGRARGPKLPKR